MKPGRELDALVAERVMGWKWVKATEVIGSRDPESFPQTFERDVLIPPHWEIKHGNSWTHPGIPSYSTNISAAWEVVEKLCEGDRFQLCYTRSGAWEAIFFVEFYSEQETAAHAICLAALKAVGVNLTPEEYP